MIHAEAGLGVCSCATAVEEGKAGGSHVAQGQAKTIPEESAGLAPLGSTPRSAEARFGVQNPLQGYPPNHPLAKCRPSRLQCCHQCDRT